MEEKKTFDTEVLLKFVKIVLPLLAAVLLVANLLPSRVESTAIENAEKMVNQDVYRSLGVVPQSFDSEVIYKDGDIRLIQVRYSLDSDDWDGTYCVCAEGEYALRCTIMMGATYDFKENLQETKALFGV